MCSGQVPPWLGGLLTHPLANLSTSFWSSFRAYKIKKKKKEEAKELDLKIILSIYL